MFRQPISAGIKNFSRKLFDDLCFYDQLFKWELTLVFRFFLFLCLFPSIAYPGLKLAEQHQVASAV